MRAAYAARGKSLGGRDAHTSTPGEAQPGGLVETEHDVRVLHGLARGALAEIVDLIDDDRPGPWRDPRRAPTSAPSVLLHARELRHDAVVEDAHRRARSCTQPRAGRAKLPFRRSSACSRSTSRPRFTGRRCGTKQTGKPSACSISGVCWWVPTRYGERLSRTKPACERGLEPRGLRRRRSTSRR